MSNSVALLKVCNLSVTYKSAAREVLAVDNISFSLQSGIMGLVGPSGCGKSSTSKALLGLLPDNAAVQGEIYLQDKCIDIKCERFMQQLRGRQIGFVPQNAKAALNPVRNIGSQIAESFILLNGETHASAWHKAQELLVRVRIPAAPGVLRAYAHELSGGMCQRVLLAIALSLNPMLLIADEPTSSVDAHLRLELLEEIKEQQQQTGMGVLLISHDLQLVEQYADAILQMNSGQIEQRGK